MDLESQPAEAKASIGSGLNSESSTASANTPSHTTKPMLPPPRTQGHTRSMTFSVRNSNRLSLSFPIQPADSLAITKQTPTSSEPSTASFPPTSDTGTTPSPGESGDFMVVIAAQERRVLELKEELYRAEAELSKLKRQWMAHEASKKRAEIRHVEQLRPVQIKTEFEPKSDEDPEDSVVRRSVELDRRKAMLLAGAKDSRRKVITGGHTRALSLLSPDRSNGFQSQPFPTVDERTALEPVNDAQDTVTGLDTSQSIPQIGLQPRARHSYQDSATVGVKQIAEDLKAGLWTFVEDLRQATIGQEPLQSPPPTSTIVKKPSKVGTNGGSTSRGPGASRGKSTSRTRQAPLKQLPNPIEVRKVHEEENLIEFHTPRSSKKTDSGLSGLDLDDDWGAWDSPVSLKSSDWATERVASPQEPEELPKRALKALNCSPSSREGIPWPALESLSTGNLKRTASAIMKEWERSLSPTPSEGLDPLSSPRVKTHSQEQEAHLSLSNLP